MVDVLLVDLNVVVHVDGLRDEAAERAPPLDHSGDGHPEQLVELLVLPPVIICRSLASLLKGTVDVLQMSHLRRPWKWLAIHPRGPLVIQRLIKHIQQTLQMYSLQLDILLRGIHRVPP